MQVGDKVYWKGINRTETGQISAFSGDLAEVSTKCGKSVICHVKSLKTSEGDVA